MSEAREFASRAELDEALARHIADGLRREIDARGSASLALSGGSTPIGMMQCLSRIDLPWDRVTVTLVDDRWVPPSHEDSNEKLLRDHLLQGRAAAATFIGLKTAPDTPQAGLAASRERLADLPCPITLTILGMGSDGHTASWFPGADNLAELLAEDNGELLMATVPPVAPHPRITLTLSAVLASREVILHITGDTKREVLAAAPAENYPIAAVTGRQAAPVSVWWAP